MAGERGFAVLGITHFSKNTSGREPLDRVTGSVAFGALARIVMACSKDKNADTRSFCRVKSNIGRDGDGFKYQLRQTLLSSTSGEAIEVSFVEWGEAIEGTAGEILEQSESSNGNRSGDGRLGEAIRFLLETLTKGALPAKEVQKMAENKGISEITLRRAREALRV